MEKTGKDRNLSYIKTLIEFSKIKRKELIEQKDFDENNDKIIIVFDLDIFKEKVDGLNEVFDQETNQFIFAFTYPSFELFLLLHIEDSYKTIIKPNEKQIIENKKRGNKRPCEYLVLQKLGINPKKNSNIGLLAENLDIAIEQETNINQTKDECLNKLTSNIGLILKNIRSESQLNL